LFLAVIGDQHMATKEYAAHDGATHDKILFWGCFIALVTTAFGFISRMFLISTWSAEFELDPAQAGRLAGIGIWPFAVSIIGFSLFIDRIGYKTAMVLAFLGHSVWAVMGVSAYFLSHGDNPNKPLAFSLLYWGSLILALGNGTVESFINPVVATMFSREKTKWLNILHAGWPGGLVLAGIITIFLGDADWWVKLGIIALPTLAYFLMLLPLRFPVQERVASGVSYREMLSEFGVLGAAVVGTLVTLQLMDFFSNGSTIPLSPTQKYVFVGIGVAIVVAFGLYTGALGRPLMFVLVLIMMPLATTELGTDGWITSIMEGVSAGDFHPGWILIYTSVIMMILRFFAGPIVHSLSPLGLLAVSSALAALGLSLLATAEGRMIMIAATLYGFGKTFFWPTMLGVVAEQTPKGGALTLNAISGIGMLTVGTLGFPFIGALQANREIQSIATSEVASQVPGLVENGQLTTLTDKSIYEVIRYQSIDEKRLQDLLSQESVTDAGAAEQITNIRSRSRQGALADMAWFPVAMLVGYAALILNFQSKGGYQAVHLE
jgi:MFS family permease